MFSTTHQSRNGKAEGKPSKSQCLYIIAVWEQHVIKYLSGTHVQWTRGNLAGLFWSCRTPQQVRHLWLSENKKVGSINFSLEANLQKKSSSIHVAMAKLQQFLCFLKHLIFFFFLKTVMPTALALALLILELIGLPTGYLLLLPSFIIPLFVVFLAFCWHFLSLVFVCFYRCADKKTKQENRFLDEPNIINLGVFICI